MSPNMTTILNKESSHHTVMQSLLWHILPGTLTTPDDAAGSFPRTETTQRMPTRLQ
jgi:hypothetical protein